MKRKSKLYSFLFVLVATAGVAADVSQEADTVNAFRADDTCQGADGSLQLLQSSAAKVRVRAPAGGGQKPIEKITLDSYLKNSTECFMRSKLQQWAVADAHLHVRPFGGPAVPFSDLIGWLQRAGTLFVTLYGIGQRLPIDSNCTYYMDCPGTPITPSMKNDFVNAQNYLDSKKLLDTNAGPKVKVFLSMSFPDLANPETILPKMRLLQDEFPGLFRWVGEVNIVKQALFNNSAGKPVPLETIPKWAPFMAELRKQDLPIAFHSDLGSDAEPLKYLPLMDKVLELYPDNKILWLHMGGLSKQLTPKKPALVQVPLFADKHSQILRERLAKHPNLWIDTSWDVLYTACYEDPAKRAVYVKLLNDFPTRFVTGSDFVAASTKTEDIFRGELSRTNFILPFLDDEAFRSIGLGQNYIDILGLDYRAPPICKEEPKK